MLKLTDDYLKLQITESSSEEMKLLPLNDSVNVVCVVRTFSGPANDSQISFYSTDWKGLSLDDFISLPKHEDFYQQSTDSLNTVSKNDFTNEMFIMEAELSDVDNSIVFRCNTLEAIGKENAELMKPYMIDSLKFDWKGGKYVKE